MRKGGGGGGNEIKTETGNKPQTIAAVLTQLARKKNSDTLAKPIILRNAACGSFNATWLPDILYKTVHWCVEG